MKRSWAGEVRNVSLLVASAVNSEGFREILGICEGAKEDKSGWSAFLRHLVDRGLTGVQLGDEVQRVTASIDSGWIHRSWPTTQTSGFDTTDIGIKGEIFRNNEHEALVSAGVAECRRGLR
jgi:Transposase, Mutator family